MTTMTKISITRALAELKLLDSRITKEIEQSYFVGLYTKRADQILNHAMSKADFDKRAMASEQSITDLIERRKKMKCAVLISNAKTMVKIGGKDYHVIEAIERKNSIVYEVALLQKLRRDHTQALSQITKNKTELQAKVDQMLQQSLSSDTMANKKDYENISKPIFEDNELKMSDPIDIVKKIDIIDKEKDEFLTEVDFILSESNSRTEIEF